MAYPLKRHRIEAAGCNQVRFNPIRLGFKAGCLDAHLVFDLSRWRNWDMVVTFRRRPAGNPWE